MKDCLKPRLRMNRGWGLGLLLLAAAVPVVANQF
jgi:hypothetical protein